MFPIFFNAWSKFSLVEVLLKTLWTVPSITFLLYCKGAQPLKFRMVPVSVGFWYHPQVTFFSQSTLTFKSKKVKLPLLSSSFTVNCKFGCKLLAASRTNPGLQLTFLIMSSTYLRKALTPFSARSASCCFPQAMQYHTVSAMSAFSNSDMLPHTKWYQLKQASHSTPLARFVTFFWQGRAPCYPHLAQSILVLLCWMQVRILWATNWPVLLQGRRPLLNRLFVHTTNHCIWSVPYSLPKPVVFS